MIDGVCNRYFWDVEKFWAAVICFNEQIFFLIGILYYFLNGIHDPINKFSFLKSIDDIVSVVENGYL